MDTHVPIHESTQVSRGSVQFRDVAFSRHSGRSHCETTRHDVRIWRLQRSPLRSSFYDGRGVQHVRHETFEDWTHERGRERRALRGRVDVHGTQGSLLQTRCFRALTHKEVVNVQRNCVTLHGNVRFQRRTFYSWSHPCLSSSHKSIL